jgi:hypothetical protein
VSELELNPNPKMIDGKASTPELQLIVDAVNLCADGIRFLQHTVARLEQQLTQALTEG